MYTGEPVTQLEHALQTATLAEGAGADAALVTRSAAARPRAPAQRPGRHADRARHRRRPPVFRAAVPAAAVRRRRARADPAARRRQALPLRDAVRAITRRCPPDSKRSLALQGGVYSAADAAGVRRAKPGAARAVELRIWDDAAKLAGPSDAAARHTSCRLDGSARGAPEARCRSCSTCSPASRCSSGARTSCAPASCASTAATCAACCAQSVANRFAAFFAGLGDHGADPEQHRDRADRRRRSPARA